MKVAPLTLKTSTGRKYAIIRCLAGLILSCGLFWFGFLTSPHHVFALALILIGYYFAFKYELKENELKKQLEEISKSA